MAKTNDIGINDHGNTMAEKIRWTDSQKQAIYLKGNVLVSASAGSGKTAVLVERITYYIETGIPLDKMLIVVYNNQAAEELRQKIGKKLLDLILEGGGEKYRLAYDSLPFCKIGTLHAFCLSTVRENFDFFDMEPSFDIATDDELQTFYKRAFKKVVENRYNEKDELFDEMVGMFGSARTDEGLFNAVLKLYDIKEIMPNGDEFLLSLADGFSDFENNVYFDEIKKDVNRFLGVSIGNGLSGDDKGDKKFFESGRLAELWRYMQEFKSDGSDKFADYLEKLYNVLSAVAGAKGVSDFSLALSALATIGRWPRASKADDAVLALEAKALKDELIKYFNAFSATFSDLEALKFSFKQNKTLVQKLVEVTLKFDEEVKKIKSRSNRVSFGDLEHMTLSLVNSERGEAIKAGVELVYVDEYQDINRLQEELILKLAPVDSCFMVGDVKQSIYGFRLADPKIFIDKLMRYKTMGNGSAVELNANFRSKSKILAFVNDLFSNIMTKGNSDYDYAETSKFIIPDENDEERVEIHLFKNAEKKKKEFVGVYDISEHEEPSDEISSAMVEGKFIAAKIKELLNSGQAKTYGQFAVLFDRRSKRAQTICETLLKEGIPISGGDFIESDFNAEWELVLLLKAIDNPLNAIPFAGYLLSYFGGYNEDELLGLGKGDLYSCLVERAKINDEFGIKAANTINQLNEYRIAASMTSVSDFLRKVILDSGYASYLRAKGDSYIDVEKFLRSIDGKEANSSVARFLEFYNAGDVEKNASLKRDSKISVMTMHASKGLEFDFVFVANCSEKFRQADKRNNLFIEQDGFIGIMGFDSQNRRKLPSISVEGTIRALNRKEFAERIRLFYVATTRAKERMYISGGEVKAGETSFMGLVLKNCMGVVEHSAEGGGDSLNSDVPEFGKPSVELCKRLSEAEKFVYPYADATTAPTKQSVSSIAEETDDGAVAPYREEFMAKGTAYHKVMQNVDFDETDVFAAIEAMKKSGTLSNSEAEVIDADEIAACLKSQVIQLAAQNRTEREKPFTMLVDSGSGDEVLVQGVCDLLIYTDDGIVLVDYKNSGRSDDALKETYFTQLDLYRRAIEESGIGSVKACVIYSFPRRKSIVTYGNL